MKQIVAVRWRTADPLTYARHPKIKVQDPLNLRLAGISGGLSNP